MKEFLNWSTCGKVTGKTVGQYCFTRVLCLGTSLVRDEEFAGCLSLWPPATVVTQHAVIVCAANLVSGIGVAQF